MAEMNLDGRPISAKFGDVNQLTNGQWHEVTLALTEEEVLGVLDGTPIALKVPVPRSDFSAVLIGGLLRIGRQSNDTAEGYKGCLDRLHFGEDIYIQFVGEHVLANDPSPVKFANRLMQVKFLKEI